MYPLIGFFYVYRPIILWALFYVKRPFVYYGTFLCTATPTLHKKGPILSEHFETILCIIAPHVYVETA